MILLIDNYDSFVFNLAHYIEELGYFAHVIRNDALHLADIEDLAPSHIILSPGPCTPLEAGICIPTVTTYAGKIPILGVCLGHQVIGHVFGGSICKAISPMHGKSSSIHHTGTGLFATLPNPLKVGRYHSLIVNEANLDPLLLITSRSDEGEIMSFEHQFFNIAGVQFHPESILTECGHALLKNFLQRPLAMNIVPQKIDLFRKSGYTVL